jgi:hypothetical protein
VIVWVRAVVDERDRYIIAKYYDTPEQPATRRNRATRRQVRSFAAQALASALREQAENFRGRRAAAVRRLEDAPSSAPRQELTRPPERQLSLL